jgi:hypothetical protein
MCQSVACSSMRAVRSGFSSSNGAARICRPIGKPAFVKPHGIVTLTVTTPTGLEEVVYPVIRRTLDKKGSQADLRRAIRTDLRQYADLERARITQSR